MLAHGAWVIEASSGHGITAKELTRNGLKRPWRRLVIVAADFRLCQPSLSATRVCSTVNGLATQRQRDVLTGDRLFTLAIRCYHCVCAIGRMALPINMTRLVKATCLRLGYQTNYAMSEYQGVFCSNDLT